MEIKMPDTKQLSIALGLVVVGFIGLTAWGCHSERVAASSKADADKLASRNNELEDLAARDRLELEGLHQFNGALQKRIDDMLRERPKAPPKAGPPPVSDPELAGALVGKGLSDGLRVAEVSFSTLSPFDARKAYSWEAEAARIPAFEAKSAADDALVLAQVSAADGLRKEVDKCGGVVVLQGRQISTLGQEVGALRTANDAQLKAQVAEVWKTRIKLGVGIPLAAYLGWRVGRR